MLDRINNFEKITIKNLILDKEFSPRTQTTIIKNNNDGIDVSIGFINKVKKSIKQDEILSYREYFNEFSTTLNIGPETEVRWDVLLDKNNHRKYIHYLKSEIAASKNLITSYYTDIYKKRRSVYLNLAKVMFNDTILEEPVYNHSSVTGRTGIVSGTNFMTMKKEKRSKLSAIDKDEVLIEIDVKSCEPSLYLKYLGKFDENTTDVYDFIKKEISLPDIPRDKFKRGILSILYGANERTSKNILKCSNEDIRKIRKYFMIDQLTSILNDQYESCGYLYNYYGRPICSNANPVNYWIQSSAVDYCSLGFLKLVKDYNLKPCFLIHDSITVAVNKSRLKEVLSINSMYEPVSKLKTSLETKVLSE